MHCGFETDTVLSINKEVMLFTQFGMFTASTVRNV